MDTRSPVAPGDGAAPGRVGAVVALKELPEAKSRMDSLPPVLRQRLARCLGLDTLAALAAAVDLVLVVSDQPDLPAALERRSIPARVVPEPSSDSRRGPSSALDVDEPLNRAYRYGADLLQASGVWTVLACVGDLPALRPHTVRTVLAASTVRARSFVDDHAGWGTTMLVARQVALDPRFGSTIRHGLLVGSSARHQRSGAVRLMLGELPEARRDVDSVGDLAAAQRLGLGPASASLVDPGTGALGALIALEVVGVDAESIIVRDGRRRTSLPWRAYDGDPAHLVPGRRLPAVRVGDSMSCWS